jgi:hypothetical protein
MCLKYSKRLCFYFILSCHVFKIMKKDVVFCWFLVDICLYIFGQVLMCLDSLKVCIFFKDLLHFFYKNRVP